MCVCVHIETKQKHAVDLPKKREKSTITQFSVMLYNANKTYNNAQEPNLVFTRIVWH